MISRLVFAVAAAIGSYLIVLLLFPMGVEFLIALGLEGVRAAYGFGEIAAYAGAVVGFLQAW